MQHQISLQHILGAMVGWLLALYLRSRARNAIRRHQWYRAYGRHFGSSREQACI